jgi:hypothetical protein
MNKVPLLKNISHDSFPFTIQELPMDNLDSKDIYLKKNGEIIGFHAVGHKGPHTYTVVHLDGTEESKTSDFMALETWGNEYSDEFQMLGRGSFRVFVDIEDAAKEMESDGWVRFERK